MNTAVPSSSPIVWVLHSSFADFAVWLEYAWLCMTVLRLMASWLAFRRWVCAFGWPKGGGLRRLDSWKMMGRFWSWLGRLAGLHFVRVISLLWVDYLVRLGSYSIQGFSAHAPANSLDATCLQAVALHECTNAFDKKLFETWLPMYQVHRAHDDDDKQIYLSPHHFGFPMMRPRLYSVLTHKKKCKMANFSTTLRSLFMRPSLDVHSLFVAPKDCSAEWMNLEQLGSLGSSRLDSDYEVQLKLKTSILDLVMLVHCESRTWSWLSEWHLAIWQAVIVIVAECCR